MLGVRVPYPPIALRIWLSWLERVTDNDEVPGSSPGIRKHLL